MKKILIVNAYYYPGFRSGGPQQSMMNLVEIFGDQAEFSVLTHNHDFGEITPYEGVTHDGWNTVGKARVYYHSKNSFSFNFLQTMANQFDIVYICEPYHDYAYKLLWLKKHKRVTADMKLAPMGTFSKGALSQKKLKKKVFWTISSWLNLFNEIEWSFTSEREHREAIEVIGERNIKRYFIAEDLPRVFVDYGEIVRKPKQVGTLKIIFLSRICKQKNLLQVIKMLSNLKGQIVLDIYGTKEDLAYWQQCLVALEELPSNVQWAYCGEIDPHKVTDVFSCYEVFCFPTLGENYGHVIYESLVAGCIPIISDQTPWNELDGCGVGHTIPLDDISQYQQWLQKYVDMSEVPFSNIRKAAMQYARVKYLKTLKTSGYRRLME
ncbi:MAG: glycosyltransferase [Aerococcaceae bacterium]|nr:glycosyltransferase [Aerococcaceae bacterium]